MSVADGQGANQTTFNNAFMSKTTDSTTVGKQTLNNADVVSGTQVTNQQTEHNSAVSYIGKAINALKNALPSWTSTAVGTGTDDLTQRAEALTVQVGTNETDIALRQLLSEKSANDGYASLDSSGLVPLAELPDSVTGAREFKGDWLASTNTPTLANGDVETAGSEYAVRDDGTVDFGAGNITFTNGDTVIYNGTIWSKIDGSIVRDINDIRDVDDSGVATGDYLRKSSGDYLAFNPDQITDDAATGSNQTLSAVTDQAVVRLTSGTLVSIDMIPAEVKARRFILVNDTGGDIDVNNLTGATAANQIITGTGLDLTLQDQASLFFVYDTTEAKWRIVGGSGAGGTFPLLAPDGNGGAPSYSFASNSATGIFTSGGGDLRFTVNGSEKLRIDSNGDLEPGTSNTNDIGSSSNVYAQSYIRQMFLSDGTNRGSAQGGNNLSNPGGFANVNFIIQSQEQVGKSISIHSRDDFAVDAVKAGNLYLQSGRKINGTGDSGDVIVHPASSAGGNRGNFAVDDGRTANGSTLRPINSDGRMEMSKAPGGALFDGPDSDFEHDEQSWDEYEDAVQNIPEDGTGGSPNVTGSHTTVVGEVLNGNGSFKLAKDAVNRQGQGFSLDKACPIAFRGKNIRISFNYLGSANFGFGTISTDSDVTVWAYNITTNTRLPLNNSRLTGEGRFESDIFIPSSCENIRFILHIATTNSSAWDLFIDDFIPELVPFTTFGTLSDITDAGTVTIGATTSAPTKGATDVDRILYRYNGDSADVRIEYAQQIAAAGTSGSGDYLLSGLPFEIDTSKVTPYATIEGAGSFRNTGNVVGSFVATNAAGSVPVMGDVVVFDKDTVRLFGNRSTGEGIIGSAFLDLSNVGTSFQLTFTVPVVGRTSGAKTPASIGLNAKAVMIISKDGGSTGANTTISSWTVTHKDTLGMMNLATGVATIKSPGDYWAGFTIDTPSTAMASVKVLVNGTEIIRVDASSGTGQSGHVYGLLEDLKYGDLVTVETATALGTLAGGSSKNKFSLFKIGSENQPYAPRIAYLKDIQTSGTEGGTFTSGSYVTRVINTVEGDESFVSISSNQIILEPGTYDFESLAPALTIGAHKSKLRNITESSDEIIGTSSFNTSSSVAASTESEIYGTISISVQTTFEIQHRCQVTRATNGLGSAVSFGDDEVYTTVRITKIL